MRAEAPPVHGRPLNQFLSAVFPQFVGGTCFTEEASYPQPLPAVDIRPHRSAIAPGKADQPPTVQASTKAAR
jgi:hypothetical protein